MSIFVRDSFFGRIVYNLSSKRAFTHPEEKPGYIVPAEYTSGNTSPTEGGLFGNGIDGEQSSMGQLVVDWDGPDDQENPKNWSTLKKTLLIAQVGILTISIYIGSSVYVPGIDQVMEEFDVSRTAAYLPLSLFVVGYGIGPMIFSPLSEHPALGRVYIYIFTLAIFVILQIPTALCKGFASLLVLRFLAGVFASPALATGGASMGDALPTSRGPFGLGVWSLCANCGPLLGPLIGAVLSEKANWRWTIWFLLIFDGAVLVVLIFFFPETSQVTLLYRKTQRLRALTGNNHLVSQGHLRIASMHPREIAIDTLWRPFEIAFGEPVVFLINVYIALMYTLLYLWFEAFPLVFVDIYGFSMVETGVCYISILLGVWSGIACYLIVIYYQFTVPVEKGEKVPPEVFLPMAIVSAMIQPTGVFIFAWSATKSAHWMGPLVGGALFGAGAFVGFQTLFNYMAFSFPRFQASVFAGNGLFRGLLAAAFPLFAKSLYTNLGPSAFPVGWGSSILGFFNLTMIAIPVLFYLNGVKLRARSKYAN
ncbi:hypothetical protein TRICI_006321 [Trichomonascus ciferrii]|uniref:Major facilitator superfamily (MFS) profile domain-containing protein n=1 Tax=Trichomonascus ciferrii TaxID=44093 RepID=A0A642UIP1_9ASCO|nr:hypothetical protein TRICI_006321 [Trichomonascus ciferrii]